ncbi:MAG: hypothetical protein ACRDL7_13195, partial [Gaiellaceae bacterium]
MGIALVSQTTTAILSAIFVKFDTMMTRLYPGNYWGEKVTHVMMDANVAEYNAITAKFGGAVVLMCYFHVVYNVNKRCRGLPSNCIVQVLKDILKMHATISEEEYIERSTQILAEWRLVPELHALAQYFQRQWIENEKFNKWQMYHTARGYASTNNPVEVFNRKIKNMTQRQVLKMPTLIQKLLDFIAVQSGIASTNKYRVSVCVPKEHLKRRYRLMMATGRLSVTRGNGDGIVKVDNVNVHAGVFARAIPRGNADRNDEESNEENAGDNGEDNGEDILDDDFVAFLGAHLEVDMPVDEDNKQEQEFQAISESYERQSRKWSDRLLETFDKPNRGWDVNVNALKCPCRYWCKT